MILLKGSLHQAQFIIKPHCISSISCSSLLPGSHSVLILIFILWDNLCPLTVEVTNYINNQFSSKNYTVDLFLLPLGERGLKINCLCWNGQILFEFPFSDKTWVCVTQRLTINHVYVPKSTIEQTILHFVPPCSD